MSKKFNSKEDKDFLRSELEKSEDIVPIDFSIVENVTSGGLLEVDDPDTLVHIQYLAHLNLY
jgi:hypothetical protein